MEFVDGDTLADRVAGGLPVGKALAIAREIAQGLEAAHAANVVHRDLKPANVKIRQDGAVKILDFGLAKALDPAAPPNGLSQAETMTSPAMMTQAGVILGTAAYMSPEQARGKPVDKRSDIWAFGCVLYEMLTQDRSTSSSCPAASRPRSLRTRSRR
jgi:eukaryotic-like serine/threonine-protein kinase